MSVALRVGAGPHPGLFTIYNEDGSMAGTVEMTVAGVPEPGAFMPIMFRGVTRAETVEPDGLSRPARLS